MKVPQVGVQGLELGVQVAVVEGEASFGAADELASEVRSGQIFVYQIHFADLASIQQCVWGSLSIFSSARFRGSTWAPSLAASGKALAVYVC